MKGWQIVVATPRPGGSDPGLEYDIVADQDRAAELLRNRKRLTSNQKTLVFGEIPLALLQFLNAMRREIYAVAVAM